MIKGFQTKPTELRLLITPIILFIDGDTEINYFERLNELKLFPNLSLKPRIGDFDQFKDYLKRNRLKHIYLIEDIDGVNKKSSDHQNIKKFQRIDSILHSKEYKSKVFYNNYSFETFLLNHKILFTNKILHKKDYDLEIKRLFQIECWSSFKTDKNRKLMMSKINHEDFYQMTKNIKSLTQKMFYENPSSNMEQLCNLFRLINDENEKI